MLNKTTEIVPRDSVESIVRQRDRALRLFETAHGHLSAAAEAVKAANTAAYDIRKGRENSYNHHIHGEKTAFMHVEDAQDGKAYMDVARKIVDTEAWAHIIEMTDLEILMDKQAKDQFRKELIENPPEVTTDNIYATLEGFMSEAGTIFRRGIANCFSKLDRRFRSHDGFKIGSRVILDNAFNEYGSWSYYRNHQDTFRDIERTFALLDNKRPPDSYVGVVALVESNRGHYGPQQSFVENDYFRIRSFKNGNAHIWFKRDDLVENVNKLLAEYYGEVVPDGTEPEDDGGLYDPKTSLAKNYGFFPTPDAAAKTVMDYAGLYRPEGAPQIRVLEPSAGTGRLAGRAVDKGAAVDCVEIHPERAALLRHSGLYGKVICADFLSIQPEETYDVIIMNPPFDRERDIDHVMHALKFLKPDGHLVSVMSAGTEFRETRKSIAFRELIEKMNGQYFDLPEGSFSSVGTYINTIILKVYKDGRPVYR